ncbi:MAG: single-stranded DNA-binding protein [Candidatus Viridilinea halotolerans]|uniref:Single-stranded DNA-binding protein n=1 Tax=Candidatus Viridilinea halotolerans TaxID=2491704 RepID=A0A426U3U7_9CHLR|nr:MAG: single-stranded DNA-binding protein [Candidatus Viridilinea halotolerans]
MARDLNKVMLIGRLGVDPEMRYTPTGSAVTTFRMAVGRQWRDSNGENREETEWFSVVSWNKLAEICNQYLTKGTRVYIEGRLQTRSWEDQQTGQTRYKTEVIASDMIILDSREGRAPREGDEYGAPRDAPRDTPRPPPRASTTPPPPDIGDEDIPF